MYVFIFVKLLKNVKQKIFFLQVFKVFTLHMDKYNFDQKLNMYNCFGTIHILKLNDSTVTISNFQDSNICYRSSIFLCLFVVRFDSK